MKIVVLADDLTGAAEMGGIGKEHGAAPIVARGDSIPPPTSMIAFDADTRHFTEAGAVARIESLHSLPPHDLFYKKTDSLLRGHMAAEIGTLMRLLGKPRALLLPQNPSKGRVIAEGRYLVNGVPLDETDFRRDPEFPRRTADVVALLGGGLAVRCVDPGDELRAEGIIVACAASAQDVNDWASRVDETTMLAGGADFFEAILRQRGMKKSDAATALPAGDKTVVVCGSACDYSRKTLAQWRAQGLPLCPLPDALFHSRAEDDAIKRWAKEIAAVAIDRKLAIISIPQAAMPDRASDLRRCMGQVIKNALSDMSGTTSLYVEGGATAAAIADALAWRRFDVLGNLAPGVVVMRPENRMDITFTMKPGSYPWPSNFLRI